jgi:hypothetical protein
MASGITPATDLVLAGELLYLSFELPNALISISLPNN